jgi:hypothetical protein
MRWSTRNTQHTSAYVSIRQHTLAWYALEDQERPTEDVKLRASLFFSTSAWERVLRCRGVHRACSGIDNFLSLSLFLSRSLPRHKIHMLSLSVSRHKIHLLDMLPGRFNWVMLRSKVKWSGWRLKLEAAERIHCELDDTRVNTAGTHHTVSIRALVRSAYVQHTSAYVNTRQHTSASLALEWTQGVPT